MTEEQAARTGFREFELRRKGKDQEQQERWTIARWMMWQEMLLSPNIKPRDKARTPEDFCRFPWEKSKAQEAQEKAAQYKITPEEIAELNKIMADWEAHKNKDDHEQDR